MFNRNKLILIFYTILIFSCATEPNKKNEEKHSLTIKVIPEEGGFVSPDSGDYSGSVEFKAHPNDGWIFDHWDFGKKTKENPFKKYISKDTEMIVKFVKLQNFEVLVEPEGTGTISPSNIPQGGLVNIVATPNPGWVFDHWEGDLNGSDMPKELLFDSNKKVKAVFKKALFSFDLAVDMRDDTGDDISKFRGVCEAIKKAGPGKFMISAGDFDPPAETLETIRKYIKANNYPWYVAVGNHEAETPEDMAWLRKYNKNGNSLPRIVNSGPKGALETCYSFDYKDTHFIVINEYYDGVSDIGNTYLKKGKTKYDAKISEELFSWLIFDFAKNNKENIFIIGHEPAFPQGDFYNGKKRHEKKSLNEYPVMRDKFWNLLKKNNVKAYITGHTHTYSTVKIDGVWQIDAGHSRGTANKDAKSTFVKIYYLGRGDFRFITYRLDKKSKEYIVSHGGLLN